VNAEKVVQNGTRMYVHKSTDKWIVLYHGNDDSACAELNFVDSFINTNAFSFIVVEYDGYGGKTKRSTERGLLKNVRDANEYLQSQKPSSVTLVGESLGAALATYHSSIKKPDKMLLVAPFDTLVNAAKVRYWFYPIDLMLLDKYRSKEWIGGADKVLVVHGTKDAIVPIQLGKTLFSAIHSKHKMFIEIEGAGHTPAIFAYKKTREAVTSFLR
jgi:pimeloyl-ACP methyl ester carboxylesterase